MLVRLFEMYRIQESSKLSLLCIKASCVCIVRARVVRHYITFGYSKEGVKLKWLVVLSTLVTTTEDPGELNNPIVG